MIEYSFKHGDVTYSRPKGDGSGNPYHDSAGKFTFSPEGARKAAKVSKEVAKGARETSQAVQGLSNRRKGPRSKKERPDMSRISDKELQQILNRERMEREYDSYFGTNQESNGEKFVNGVGIALSYAAAIATIAGVGFSIYSSVASAKKDANVNPSKPSTSKDYNFFNTMDIPKNPNVK